MREIDFLYDNTAIALAELYFEWQETGKLNYDDEDSTVWSSITEFTASATARKDLFLFQNEGVDDCIIHAYGNGKRLTLEFIGEYRPHLELPDLCGLHGIRLTS